MRFIPLLILAGWWGSAAVAQAAPPAKPTVRKHLIYFKDKANSPYSTAQPQAYLSARALARRTRQGISLKPRDLPVNPGYVAQVKAVSGTQLWYTSRWFNAALVSCDSATLALVRALPCVQGAQTLNRGQGGAPAYRDRELVSPAQQRAAPADYGIAYGQNQMIGAVAMHNASFRGEGMQIAIFDEGFPGVNKAAGFTSLIDEQRLASTFNVVEKSTSVFLRGEHGTNCLSTMAGNQPGYFIGTAPKATYRLFITEDEYSEHPVEEANWLIAAEYADSAGVDVISSSLGYNEFDAPSADYTYADLNGRTAISSRAATVAARVGMLVVNSAGNEGAKPWHYIMAPADADSIVTVGAVTSSGSLASFSSVGPTADGRLKPNLVAQGVQSAILSQGGYASYGSGTSFACPILAGMATGFWQANPNLTAQQVIDFLQRSGNRATAPTNEYGYGLPNFVTAYNLANPAHPLATRPATAAGALAIYPNPRQGQELYLQLSPAFRATPLRLRIFDARGGLVREVLLPATPNPEVRLGAGPLEPGLYTCTVSTGIVQQTVRFVQL